MWVRGLKLLIKRGVRLANLSHPMWVRGSKPFAYEDTKKESVAPHVGAWIETVL